MMLVFLALHFFFPLFFFFFFWKPEQLQEWLLLQCVREDYDSMMAVGCLSKHPLLKTAT